MRFVDEYRDPVASRLVLDRIEALADPEIGRASCRERV